MFWDLQFRCVDLGFVDLVVVKFAVLVLVYDGISVNLGFWVVIVLFRVGFSWFVF